MTDLRKYICNSKHKWHVSSQSISECLLVAESFISAQDSVNRLLMPTLQLTYKNNQIPRSYLKCLGRLYLDTSTVYSRKCEVYVCKLFNVSNCTDVKIYPKYDRVTYTQNNSELCVDGYQMFMCLFQKYCNLCVSYGNQDKKNLPP
jgi:hypothetical protein